MKSVLDKSFSYTPSHETDIGRRFKQASTLNDIATLIEVMGFLEDYADVVDGEFGPKPNLAMTLKREVENLISKLKESV